MNGILAMVKGSDTLPNAAVGVLYGCGRGSAAGFRTRCRRRARSTCRAFRARADRDLSASAWRRSPQRRSENGWIRQEWAQ